MVAGPLSDLHLSVDMLVHCCFTLNPVNELDSLVILLFFSCRSARGSQLITETPGRTALDSFEGDKM